MTAQFSRLRFAVPMKAAALALLLALPLSAQTSPLVFTPTEVSAPVVPGGSAVWFNMHADSRRSLAQIDFRADSDGDGFVQWQRLPTDPSLRSIWTAVDMTSGRLMAGRPPGAIPAQTAFPPKAFLRDADGHFSNLVLDISKMRSQWESIYLLWVRPGTGAWFVETADDDPLTDRDSSFNDLLVLQASQFEPVGTAPAPAGFAAGDVLVGIDIAAEHWFGDAVDAHLGETGGPGVLSAYADHRFGEAVPRPVGIHVLRREGSDGTVSVRYATENGTALAGVHYEAVAGTLTFGPGEIVKTIHVPLIDDNLYSGDTSFKLNLTDPAGAPLGGPASFTFTIAEDDPKPHLSIVGGMTVQEGGAGTYEIPLAVRLTGATRLPVTATWEVSSNPGVPNGGTLVFAPGETEKLITFRYAGNTIPGDDRTYTVSLNGVQNATSGSAQIRIVDDDYATLSMDDVSVSENAFSVAVPIRLSAPGRAVTLKVTTVDGTAKAGVDYEARSGTMEFRTSSSVEYLSIPILRDLLLTEADETFEVVVSEVTDATVVRGRATVTIVNAEPPPPGVILDNWAGLESSDATFVLRISAPYFRDVTVVATTRATGTTATAGSDFVPKSQTLTIPAGQTSTTFVVDVVDDAVAEGPEVFAVDLTQLTNATFGFNPFAVGSIADDDGPMLTVDDATIAEGDAGTSTLRVRVRLNMTSATAIRVNYAAQNGTALVDRDFLRSSGTLTFNPGELEKFIDVTILGDRSFEPDETFTMQLSTPQGASIARAIATCTIVNDDEASPSKRRSARH